MPGLNKIMLLGHVGKNPETKTLSNGHVVTNFSVATSERWKDKQSGELNERTEWHQVVTWGHTAKYVSQYISKGNMIFVEGKLQTSSWEDNTGNMRYRTEVMATSVEGLGSRQPSNSQSQNHSQNQNQNRQQNNVKNFAPGADNFGPAPDFNQNDEIPF